MGKTAQDKKYQYGCGYAAHVDLMDNSPSYP
jgi:hypothetical protein